jgi:hypothetical protein
MYVNGGPNVPIAPVLYVRKTWQNISKSHRKKKKFEICVFE